MMNQPTITAVVIHSKLIWYWVFLNILYKCNTSKMTLPRNVSQKVASRTKLNKTADNYVGAATIYGSRTSALLCLCKGHE